jgi:phosphoglycolate phosphatase
LKIDPHMRKSKALLQNGGTMMQSKKERVILFDLDGTLTDSAEGILKSVRIVLDHYAIAVREDDNLHAFIGPPLRVMFAKYGVPADEVENAVKLYRTRYFSVGKFENRPYDGIRALLARLSREGYRLYVATSKPEELAVEILTHFGLAQYFDRIAGACIGAGRDSKSAVIRHLFEQIGVSPAESGAVMVGDTYLDIEGARKHSLRSVGVTWGYGIEQEMRDAGADAIVETVDALYHTLCGMF